MDDTWSSGGVTSRAGDVGADGEIVGVGGYRGTGTSLDPGHYRERPGLDERLAASITADRPSMVEAQLAGIRRMLTRTAVA